MSQVLGGSRNVSPYDGILEDWWREQRASRETDDWPAWMLRVSHTGPEVARAHRQLREESEDGD